jgi:hypothetical protein
VVWAHGNFERVLVPKRNASLVDLLVAFLSFLALSLLSLLSLSSFCLPFCLFGANFVSFAAVLRRHRRWEPQESSGSLELQQYCPNSHSLILRYFLSACWL